MLSILIQWYNMQPVTNRTTHEGETKQLEAMFKLFRHDKERIAEISKTVWYCMFHSIVDGNVENDNISASNWPYIKRVFFILSEYFYLGCRGGKMYN